MGGWKYMSVIAMESSELPARVSVRLREWGREGVGVVTVCRRRSSTPCREKACVSCGGGDVSVHVIGGCPYGYTDPAQLTKATPLNPPNPGTHP